MKKTHFKMFKAGKKWMVAGVVTMAMGTGAIFATSINANADVVANASSYIGNTTWDSMDCSSLVQQAFAADGINLPRTSSAQYAATTPISASDAQPGDLVFFGPNGSEHVGIYAGNGTLIDSEYGYGQNGVVRGSVAALVSTMGQASYRRVNGGVSAAPAQFNANNNQNIQDQPATPAAPATGDQTNNGATDASQADSSVNNNADAQKDAASVENDASKATAPKESNSNKKDTLPATGESNNSFLAVIGAVLVSLVSVFGIKLRKNI